MLAGCQTVSRWGKGMIIGQDARARDGDPSAGERSSSPDLSVFVDIEIAHRKAQTARETLVATRHPMRIDIARFLLL